MAQTTFLMEVLKSALKARGVTYAQVAPALGLSHASVKRVFASGDLSLSRLEAVCTLIGLEILDLLELARARQAQLQELDADTEQTLAGNPRLLLVGILALTGWEFDEMLATYRFGRAELVGLLARLSRLGIIDLLPGDRIRMRLARDFRWRSGGPIQRFFEQKVQEEFYAASFIGPRELRLTVHGSLSDRSNELLQQRMRRLVEEFVARSEEDRHLPRHMAEGTTLVVALRPWELKLFTDMRRK